MFESAFNSSLNPADLLLSTLSKPSFTPTQVLNLTIGSSLSTNEQIDLVQILTQIEQTDKLVAEVETKIQSETKKLKQEQSLNEENSIYDIIKISSDANKLKEDLNSLLNTTEQDNEQMKVVSEELIALDLKKKHNQQILHLIELIESYQNNPENFSFTKEKIENFAAEEIIQKIHDLQLVESALKSINYQEFEPVKLQVSKDLNSCKFAVLDNFKQKVKEKDYEASYKLYKFLYKTDLSPQVSSVLFQKLIGSKIEVSSNTKEAAIDEFLRYLYILQKIFSQFEQKEDIISRICRDGRCEVMTSVSLQLTEDCICSLAREMLSESLDKNRREFFLDYLDEFGRHFREFKKKCEGLETVWSILENMDLVFEEMLEQFQQKYFDIEKEELQRYLTSFSNLELNKVGKKIVDLKQEFSREKKLGEELPDPSFVVMELIKEILKGEKIENFIQKTKKSISRCYRNSKSHKRSANCGELLEIFLEKINELLTQLLDRAEAALPEAVQQKCASLPIFEILGSVISLSQRIELLVLEFKDILTNFFKLDEVEKTKNLIIKDLNLKIKSLLERAIGNMFAEGEHIWNRQLRSRKKKSGRKIKDWNDSSPECKEICDFFSVYIKIIKESLGKEYLSVTMSHIGKRFVGFLMKSIPSQSYSYDQVTLLQIDLEEYHQCLEITESREVEESFLVLKRLVGLLFLKDDELESYLRGYDLVGEVGEDIVKKFLGAREI